MRSVTGLEGNIDGLIDNKMTTISLACAASKDEVKKFVADDKKTPVTLPVRYKQKLGKGREGYGNCHNVADDLDSREEDLGVALKWIRQEILQMKEQDKSLLKQFIELRASILQLRCLYQLHSSNSDVSSLDGSTASLNDVNKHHCKRHITRADSDFLDFSSRTKSLLSLQNSPRFTRIKWRSDEYI